MTVERIELPVGPALEPMEPVSPVPAVQGQSPMADADSKRKRRLPPAAAASEKQEDSSEADLSEADERPQHQVDKLA
jgi:hypothetical protein